MPTNQKRRLRIRRLCDPAQNNPDLFAESVQRVPPVAHKGTIGESVPRVGDSVVWFRRRLIITAAAVVFLNVCVQADAALAPGTVEKMRNKAPEVLQIEVLTATKGQAKGEDQQVTYTAKVVSVTRSASQLKVGTEIRIESYIRNPNFTGLPQPGPAAPDLLPQGWTGTAYLRPIANTKALKIAVFGHSFVKK